jgi:hypothetical protein
VNRRSFITLLSGAAAGWPLALRAQQAAGVRRVGMLMDTTADNAEGRARVDAFQQQLKELGWVEGRPQLIESARRDCKLKESTVGMQSGRPQPPTVILNDRPAD